MRNIRSWLFVGLALVVIPWAPEAAAQTRPAIVRSVDEPARVPYFYSINPNCPFTNVCEALFPAVPTGKRLRVTYVAGLFRFTNDPGFFAVNVDTRGNLLVAFQVSPFSGAYYGNLITTSQQVDLYFEAGQSPLLEFGIPAFGGGIFDSSANRFIVSGYLVDLLP